MFPFLNNSNFLPNIRKLKFQRWSNAMSKRNQWFSNRWYPENMLARISGWGNEVSVTESRGQLIVHSSSAWFSFPVPSIYSEIAITVSSWTLITVSEFTVLEYLPFFISSSQLKSLLLADAWDFIGMNNVSHELVMDYITICIFCVHRLPESLRQGAIPESLFSKKELGAEFRPHCTSLCPFGPWKPWGQCPLLDILLLHPRRLHWGPTPDHPARLFWPEEPGWAVLYSWMLRQL